ncbi:MAG: hypothetical protein ACI9HK_003668 [Pirellulaceae bacterium]|jgi:hypothetical protein
MILEGIVTSRNADDSVNVSPMGPRVDDEMLRFVLRPFQTSTTYKNLKRTGLGVLHVTDNVEMMAAAAIGKLTPPNLLDSSGLILADCCRWYQFKVTRLDDSNERTTIDCEVVQAGRVREFFGLNRGKYAVIEAAILATRIGIIPDAAITYPLKELSILVDKTGGESERRAFDQLQQFITDKIESRQREATS